MRMMSKIGESSVEDKRDDSRVENEKKENEKEEGELSLKPAEHHHHHHRDASIPKRVKVIYENPWTLQFDGAAKPNPGQAGCGWVLYDNQRNEYAKGYKYLGDKQTNNVAEYSAAIAGLKFVLHMDRKPKRLVVQGDSNLVIGHVSKGWTVTKPHLRVCLNEVNALIDNLKKNNTLCIWEHIPREQNGVADELSNVAVQEKCTKIFILH